MDITYLGHSSFKIKGKSAVIVTDPFSSQMVGFKFPKCEADIVTVSHQHEDHNAVNLVEGGPLIIDLPGEYETKGISIFGFSSFHDSSSGEKAGKNTIFLIEIDGVKVCHLGDIGCFPSAKILDEISIADILMIPVGGVATITSKEAKEIIKQIDPFIILPMHYRTDDINQQVFGKFSTVEEFLKETGNENCEKLDKLSITKDKLPEEAKIILLERKQ